MRLAVSRGTMSEQVLRFTRSLWARAAGADEDLAVPLKAAALKQRRRFVTGLRWASQWFWLLVTIAVGAQFMRWVRQVETGVVTVGRPGGVEAFLPLSALLSLRHLWETGEISPVRPAGFMIFLAVAATGLLMKRAFCSWVCPVGTASEWLAGLSRRAFGRKLALPRWLDIPMRSLKYLLLLFFASAIFFRMSGADVAMFLDSPYNRVADVKMLYFFEQLSPFAAKVILGLVALSIVIPYFWCRYLCPYGALLGFLSLLSPLKVTRDAGSCIDCDLCTKACPSHLPVAKLTRVSSDECVGCLSCVAACPVPRALRVETPAPWRRALRPAAFAVVLLVLFGGTMVAAQVAGVWRTNVSDEEYVYRLQELNDPRYGHPR